jgi:hypothetical protein
LALSLPVLAQYELPPEVQRVVPEPHVEPHLPAEQIWPPVHAVPHAPQLTGSVFTSTHDWPHWVLPPEHDRAHLPEEHTCPAVHAAAQAPQLSGSFVVSTHAPPHAVFGAAHEKVASAPPSPPVAGLPELLLLHPAPCTAISPVTATAATNQLRQVIMVPPSAAHPSTTREQSKEPPAPALEHRSR